MSGFRPGWLPSLAVALLLPLLLGLGFWQLSRAEEKRQLEAAFEARRQAPAVSLTELLQMSEPNHQRVRLHGQFDTRHSLLLDNRQRDGRVGVELLQPFQDQASGLWLLVNRGWLPWPDRRVAPQFSTPQQPIELIARVYLPAGAAFQLQADAPGSQWPRLVTLIDAPALWSQLGRSGYVHELRLQPGPAAYQAEWPLLTMSPQRHVGYAVQWFALAAALLGLYIYFGRYNARSTSHSQERLDESSL